MERLLALIRAAGWRVQSHVETCDPDGTTCYWRFVDGNGSIIRVDGASDNEALSKMRAKIGLEPAEPLRDAGPWTVGTEAGTGRVFLQSEDFTHDVRLRIDGDFASDGDRLDYAANLAIAMNGPAAADAGKA